MTRLTTPLRRLVAGDDCDLVAELHPAGVLLRPKRSRRPDAVVWVYWQTIYRRALLARVAPISRRRRRPGRTAPGKW